MPLPKELGPAQPRVNAGHSERKPSGQPKEPPRSTPAADAKAHERTPGTGALADDPQGREVDPGSG
ncbi:MAG: hypothetical protein QOD74_1306 [Variibacter sp.]|nr:hypothetical protein [Variibacter sp.]